MSVFALDVAHFVRSGESDAKPIDLWRLADKEARGATDLLLRASRIQLFRHAMIHAGFVDNPDRKGEPYRICPMCDDYLDTE